MIGVLTEKSSIGEMTYRPWSITSSSIPFESNKPLPKGIIPPFLLALIYSDLDYSSVMPKFVPRNEAIIRDRAFIDGINESISDNDIFEAMLDNDTDVKMPPTKEYKIILRYKVEKNNGPYRI